MNHSEFKNSVMKRIMLFIVGISIVTLGIFAFVSIVRQSSYLTKGLNQTASVVLAQTSQSLAIPLWNVNNDMVVEILKSEMIEKQVQAIIIKDTEKDSILFGMNRDKQGSISTDLTNYAFNALSMSTAIVKDNTKLGILTIYVTKKEMQDQIKSAIVEQLVETVSLSIILFVVIYYCISLLVLKPMKSVVMGLHEISQGKGDLTQRLKVRNTDEIGELCQEVNEFIQNLQQMVLNVKSSANNLITSASEIVSALRRIQSASENVGSRASSVFTTVSDNNKAIFSITDNAVMLSYVMENVVNLINQISDSVKDSSAKCHLETGHASKAMSYIAGTKVKIGHLSEAGSVIGKFVDTINDIAEQTKLLALNATIEAACAGEAGKGFSVVASEVKQLSRQTADATNEISQQVETITRQIGETVISIDAIVEIVRHVNTLSDAIAESLTKQSNEINQINENIQKASISSVSITDQIKNNSQGLQEISKNIELVSSEMKVTNAEIATINSHTQTLERQAENLAELMSRFKVDTPTS